MPLPTVETERLLLRPWRAEDLDPYAAMCADEETMRHLAGGTLSRDDTWRQIAMFVGHWHLRGFGIWAVEEKASGAFAGRIGVWYPEGWPLEEISYSLAPGFRGRGLATEAAAASRDWAFWTLGLPALCSLIRPANAASIRVAERLGARNTGPIVIRGGESLVYRMERGSEQQTASRG